MLKHTKYRLVLSILLIMLSFLLLCGCESDPAIQDGTEDDTTNLESSAETEAPAALPDSAEWLPLSENGKPLYNILYQTQGLEDGVSPSDYAQTARNIAAKLNEKLGNGERFDTVSDRNIPTDIKTVTVGKVTGYSDGYYDGMRFQDFRIREQDGNVAIACYTSSALYIASEHFLDGVKLIDGDLYVKRSVLGESYSSYYQISDMTVGSASIADYTIVCNDESESAANSLRLLIRTYSGFMLQTVKDTEAAAAKEIVVGTTSRNTADAGTMGYNVYRQDEKLIVACSEQLEWNQLLAYVENRLKNITSGGSYDLDGLASAYTIPENSRKIMTYNVRNVWSDGSPGTRDDLTAQMILKYAPDIVCLQEFDVYYRKAANGLISLISEGYAEVKLSGVSESDVWNPIFYNSQKYSVVDSGIVFFPDYVDCVEYPYTPGGTSNGQSKFRSLVWAVLQDKTDGSYYVIGNLHFSAGTETHNAEANLVANKLKEIAAQYPGCTTLVTGDYNSARNSSAGGLKYLLSKDFYDTYDNSARRNDYGTTHTLSTTTLPSVGYMSYAIDHVLTLNSDLSVYTYYVILDEAYLPLSDHCATIVQFSAAAQ